MKRQRVPAAVKMLFVCSRNRRRGLTAEKMMAGLPGYDVRSAGTQAQARIVVTEGMIGWADVIFVMEKSHLNHLRLKFPEAMVGKEIVTLLIPDDFGFMQPELMDELKGRLNEWVTWPGE